MQGTDITSREGIEERRVLIQQQESAFARKQETEMQKAQNTFISGESALERTQRITELEKTQAFQKTENDLERTNQRLMQRTAITSQEAQQESQLRHEVAQQIANNTFKGTEAQLDRVQQMSLQTSQIASNERLASRAEAAQRALTLFGIQAQKDMQKTQNAWQTGENSIKAAAEVAWQTADLSGKKDILKIQDEYSEAAKRKEETFIGSQNELNRVLTRNEGILDRTTREKISKDQTDAQIGSTNASIKIAEGQITQRKIESDIQERYNNGQYSLALASQKDLNTQRANERIDRSSEVEYNQQISKIEQLISLFGQGIKLKDSDTASLDTIIKTITA